MQNATVHLNSGKKTARYLIEKQSINMRIQPVFFSGMSIAKTQAMTVAMPIWDGRVSPVLDVAGRFLVVQIQNGSEISRREVLVAETQPPQLAKGIKEMGAEVLVCGAMSQSVAYWLANVGVRVWPHVCGEAEAVLHAFLTDTLEQAEFRMPGCCLGSCAWHGNRGRRRGYLGGNLNRKLTQQN
jgi:predicted Fe-Mo cluster-binding NifX family protein